LKKQCSPEEIIDQLKIVLEEQGKEAEENLRREIEDHAITKNNLIEARKVIDQQSEDIRIQKIKLNNQNQKIKLQSEEIKLQREEIKDLFQKVAALENTNCSSEKKYWKIFQIVLASVAVTAVINQYRKC
jgi:DNA-binding response OmpR family regulator